MALDILEAVAKGVPVFGVHKVTGPARSFIRHGGRRGPNRGAYAEARSPTRYGVPFKLQTERIILPTPSVWLCSKRELEKIKPVLIVVDTAREALGIKRWEDSSEVGDKLRPVRELARELCSVLLVAHNRKMDGSNGDEIAGTNGFTSNVDGWASIQKKEIYPMAACA